MLHHIHVVDRLALNNRNANVRMWRTAYPNSTGAAKSFCCVPLAHMRMTDHFQLASPLLAIICLVFDILLSMVTTQCSIKIRLTDYFTDYFTTSSKIQGKILCKILSKTDLENSLCIFTPLPPTQKAQFPPLTSSCLGEHFPANDSCLFCSTTSIKPVRQIGPLGPRGQPRPRSVCATVQPMRLTTGTGQNTTLVRS